MSDRIPAIRVLLLPKDTNAYGTIFGGVILSNIDLASAVEARKLAPHRFVTKAMHEVEFHEPVFVGDLVDFYTETVRVGRTSVTVRVSVEAERWGSTAIGERTHPPRRAGEGDRGRGRARRRQRARTSDSDSSGDSDCMKWVSTRGASPPISFVDALFAGTAPDGGLYMPERLDPLPAGTCRAPDRRRHRHDRDDDRRAPAAGRDHR